MFAWRVHELGEPADALRLDRVADLEPGAGEVVVRIRAAALNFADVLLCRGQYQERPELPFVPGSEASAEVVALGPGADPALAGRRVIAYLRRGGAFAELARVPAAAVFPIPDALDDVTAAAFHVTYQTGHVALHRRAGLQPGETLLVHAGAGGVGSAAIELGRAAGARVLATAGGPEKAEICRALGADIAIDSRAEDFVAAVNDATGGRGADVIYDPVGGDTFDRSRRCVAFEGRILVIGFAGGRIAEAPTNHALVKNYSIVGVHWGLYEDRAPEVIRAAHDELVALHAGGAIRPRVSEVVEPEALPAALTALAAGATVGKVVVRIGAGAG
jgi:NADPH:quinone reductase-like Zn-dependent oxidoreductase